MKNKKMKKPIKIVLICLVTILLLVGAYAGYVFGSYSRLDEYTTIEVDDKNNLVATTNKEYGLVTYNIGMGIYSQDFGFFMDGGTKGRADSIDKVNANNDGIISNLLKLNPDFLMIEETAVDCSASYHVNQLQLLKDNFSSYDVAFGQNWDSPYLAVPPFSAFGKAKTGLTTLSKYNIEEASRVGLPVEEKITKIVDLDRCYTKSIVSLDNNKKLVLFVIHPSAYTSDGVTAYKQIEILMNDMQQEYAKGNYVIAGGDWNRDLYGDSWQYFVDENPNLEWTRNFDKSALPEHFSIVDCIDDDNPVPSSRNADGPLNDKQAQMVIDGFIVSDNVTITSAEVIDLQFLYSDHNPVYMTFALN